VSIYNILYITLYFFTFSLLLNAITRKTLIF